MSLTASTTSTTSIEHPEWTKDNSLSTPSDRINQPLDSSVGNTARNLANTSFDIDAPELNNEQTKEATAVLNNSTFVRSFPRIERRLADPALELQRIGLISFVPSKGATPDANGIYGFAKLRGNFATEEEASFKAQELIRKVDSYHQVYHAYVGRPFPLTTTSDYSKYVDRVDLQKEASESISRDVKSKREKEQQDIEEIKKREQELLADVAKEKEDNDDRYTTLRVKKAQLVWTYSETKKKLDQMIVLIAKARKEIEDLEATDSNLIKVYYQKYVDSRKQAGLSLDPAVTDQTFMRYLVEDLKLPEVDAEYDRLYR